MAGQALQLALHNRQQGGRPFAALLVRDNQLVTSAVNGMHQDGDPTRHAELEALRQASQVGPLAGAIVYASGHPCPMCLSALVMNGIAAVYYAFDNEDAAPFGFDSTCLPQAGPAPRASPCRLSSCRARWPPPSSTVHQTMVEARIDRRQQQALLVLVI